MQSLPVRIPGRCGCTALADRCSLDGAWSKRPWEDSGGPAGEGGATPTPHGGVAAGVSVSLQFSPGTGLGRRSPRAQPTASPAALQLGLRHAAAPEGGGEEAVAPLSVADPCAEDLPGAAAAQTPEAREREPAPRAGRVGGPAPRRGADAPPRQVIGLLDVFTPAASIEDFSEV